MLSGCDSCRSGVSVSLRRERAGRRPLVRCGSETGALFSAMKNSVPAVTQMAAVAASISDSSPAAAVPMDCLQRVVCWLKVVPHSDLLNERGEQTDCKVPPCPDQAGALSIGITLPALEQVSTSN